MKNYYVTSWPTFKMTFRGTLQECRDYAANLVRQWREVGNSRMEYAIFYDTGTLPFEIVK